MLGVRFPSTAADINRLCCRDRLADGVTNVAVTRFGLCTVLSTAHISIARLVTRTTNVVADRSVAGLVTGLADVVTDISVAGLVTRFAYIARDRSPARFRDRTADLLLHASVMCFVNRLAYGVALLPITCLIHISSTRDRHSLSAAVIHRLHASVLLLVPDDFSDGAVLNSASTLSRCEVSTFIARICRTTREPS